MSTDEMHNIVFFDDEASIKCDVSVDNLLSVNHRGNQVSRVDVKVTDEILKPLNYTLGKKFKFNKMEWWSSIPFSTYVI